MERRPLTSTVARAAGVSGERSTETASAIYGAILVTAVIAALSEDHGAGARELLAAALDTSIVFWLAHVYAQHVGERAATTDRAQWHSFRALLGRELPMVVAAFLPLAALALGAANVLSRDTAVTAALTAGVVELFFWGTLAGRHEHGPLRALVGGVANAGLGVLVVLLKVLVH
jgi:hypothetical protein